ncbi:MAG: hypothetical protein V7749_15585 [Cocleimonas sp.]
MSEKEVLLKTINEKKAELISARKGTDTWKSGRTQKSGNSQLSVLSVQSLEKEIKSLSEELRKLQNAK